MKMDSPAPDVLTLTLDAAGRIRSADPSVLRLQIAAGGEPDGPLFVPQLAAIAALANRLRVLVARPAIAALDHGSIAMWVRARPTEEGVELSLSDWRESPFEDDALIDRARGTDIVSIADGWSWVTDRTLHVVDCSEAPDGERAQAGEPLASVFSFDVTPDRDGAALAAMVQHRAFHAERLASLRLPGRSYLVSGHPLFDATGAFDGYRGKALLISAEGMTAPAEGSAADAPPLSPSFGRQLDGALRQPIGRIIANADSISGRLKGPLRNDYASYAADIADAGRHLLGLVDDLADLTAIDRPGFKVAREDVDLADIGRRASGLLSLKAGDRHIRLDVPVAGESVIAIGEFRRVLQIVVNLVGNAIRYSPENSVVWVRADEDEVDGRAVARLVVADQGEGIAPEDHVRVFEKFERLGRQDSGGSGLGLYISRRLARAMEGDLTLDSAKGQGARFILTLPLRQG